MPVESIGSDTKISGLNENYPTNGDPIQEGATHLRNIKRVLKRVWQDVGTVFDKDTGNSAGEVPVLNSDGQWDVERLPTGTEEGDIALLGPDGKFLNAQLNTGTANGNIPILGEGGTLPLSTVPQLDTTKLPAGTLFVAFDSGWQGIDADIKTHTDSNIPASPVGVELLLRCQSAVGPFSAGDVFPASMFDYNSPHVIVRSGRASVLFNARGRLAGVTESNLLEDARVVGGFEGDRGGISGTRVQIPVYYPAQNSNSFAASNFNYKLTITAKR